MLSFLGCNLLPEGAKFAFTCVEKKSGEGPGALLASGQSVQAVFDGYCCPDPKVIP